MKKMFTTCLVAAGMAVMSVCAMAQTVSFQQDRDFRDLIGWPSHRTVPVVMDFNNDGIMDAYYGGTSCVNGWQARGVLVKGLGDGQFEGVTTPKVEPYTTQEPKVKVDGEGNPMQDEGGNPIYETDPETGDVIYEEVQHERVVGMANGLPYAIFNTASQPIDYNQDGFVDLLIVSAGGNDTGTEQGIYLVKNNGDFTFEVVFPEFFTMLPRSNQGSNYNGDCRWGAASIADYDKDGYPDIVIENDWSWDPRTDQWGRCTRLLHNLKGEGWEDANVFRPIAFDKEINRRYIYTKTADEVVIDDDGVEQTIPGKYIDEPTYCMKPMSGSNVTFVDLNNDGWDDIIAFGWADGDDTEVGGQEFRYYENTKDGWFTDATEKLYASFAPAGAALDSPVTVDNLGALFQCFGGDDNVVNVIDWDQNGTEDLLLVGSCIGKHGKQAFVLLNASTPDEIVLLEQPTSLIPMSGLAPRIYFLNDLNGDDVVDFMGWGWSDYQGWNDWAAGFCESAGTVDSYIATLFDDGLNPVSDPAGHVSGGGNGTFFGANIQKEMTGIGDLNNDGKLDFLANGWTEKSDDIIPSYNTTDYVVSKPEAPTGVAATEDESGTVTITWDDVTLLSGGQAMYNVYAINEATGAMRMLVPADPKTGAQNAVMRFSRYITSGGNAPAYTMPGLDNGTYTIGVQAVNYASQGSAFATTTVEVKNNDNAEGIKNVAADKLAISASDHSIIVSGVAGTKVTVFTAGGQKVAEGVTGTAIPVSGQGVFVVKAGTKTAKIAK